MRFVAIAVALFASTVAPAQGQTPMPDLGTWKGKNQASDEGVGFQLVRSGEGYRAASTRLFVAAPCTPGNPTSAVRIIALRLRRVSVKLSPSGTKLVGTRKIVRKGRGTQTVSIAISFSSARRAKVVVKGRYEQGDETCKGRLAVTARPTASAATASPLNPKAGPWEGSGSGSQDSVRFTVKKAGDNFSATSTRLSMSVGCDAPDPRDSTYGRVITARGVTVKLSPAGKRLRGSRKVTRRFKAGDTTETVSIAITFTGTRRAKVVVNATTKSKGKNVNPNAANCGGRLAVTAKPQ